MDFFIVFKLDHNELILMMLSFGYLGEIGALLAWPAFAGGMLGWFFILFEIFNGEAGGTASGCSAAVASSFSTMRLIVTVGWSIYPLGYLFGYMLGAVDQVFLNVLYNIADFVNKIAFVLSCWACAKAMRKPLYVAAESYKFARLYPLNQRDLPDSHAHVVDRRAGCSRRPAGGRCRVGGVDDHAIEPAVMLSYVRAATHTCTHEHARTH